MWRAHVACLKTVKSAKIALCRLNDNQNIFVLSNKRNHLDLNFKYYNSIWSNFRIFNAEKKLEQFYSLLIKESLDREVKYSDDVDLYFMSCL